MQRIAKLYNDKCEIEFVASMDVYTTQTLKSTFVDMEVSYVEWVWSWVMI